MHALDRSAAAAATLLLSLMGLSVSHPARAANVAVSNCNNSGVGSLRNAAAIAVDGDVIDLRAIPCNRILLTSGPIVFDQFTITLQGPGYTRLAIDGGGHSAVLRHHQTGTGGSTQLIRVLDLTVRWGFIDDPVAAYGACIYSGGSVELQRVQVHHCVARSTNVIHGAGVAARRNLRMTDSKVFTNRAVLGSPNAYSSGGGVFGQATLLLDHSSLLDNQAQAGGGGYAGVLTASYSTVSRNVGGGVQMNDGTVDRSTFSDNADYGLYIRAGSVANSTFSGNRGPGLLVEGGALWQNTIAYNTVARVDGVCRGGLDLQNAYSQLRGNLVVHNTCDGMPLDYTSRGDTRLYTPSSRNLIMYASGYVPPDTLTTDPHLLALANNGGPTLTHALPSGSVAINRGSSRDVGPYDQRGPGFARRVGPTIYADIGAFERQQP